jgi:hypothetical protein
MFCNRFFNNTKDNKFNNSGVHRLGKPKTNILVPSIIQSSSINDDQQVIEFDEILNIKKDEFNGINPAVIQNEINQNEINQIKEKPKLRLSLSFNKTKSPKFSLKNIELKKENDDSKN